MKRTSIFRLPSAREIWLISLLLLLCAFHLSGMSAPAHASTSGSEAGSPYLSPPLEGEPEILVGFGDTYLTGDDGNDHTHYGIDLAGTTGAPVFAASAGKVSYVGRTIGVTGGDIDCITITDVNGNKLTYRPIEPELALGSSIERGSIIGSLRVSGDGSSAAVHLNLSVRNSAGDYIDPWPLFLPFSAPVEQPNVSMEPVLGTEPVTAPDTVKVSVNDTGIAEKIAAAPETAAKILDIPTTGSELNTVETPVESSSVVISPAIGSNIMAPALAKAMSGVRVPGASASGASPQTGSPANSRANAGKTSATTAEIGVGETTQSLSTVSAPENLGYLYEKHVVGHDSSELLMLSRIDQHGFGASKQAGMRSVAGKSSSGPLIWSFLSICAALLSVWARYIPNLMRSALVLYQSSALNKLGPGRLRCQLRFERRFAHPN